MNFEWERTACLYLHNANNRDFSGCSKNIQKFELAGLKKKGKKKEKKERATKQKKLLQLFVPCTAQGFLAQWDAEMLPAAGQRRGAAGGCAALPAPQGRVPLLCRPSPLPGKHGSSPRSCVCNWPLSQRFEPSRRTSDPFILPDTKSQSHWNHQMSCT